MAITEIGATHQLDIRYQVVGLNHVLQMRCNGYGTGIGVDQLITTPDGLIGAQDAADDVFSLLSPIYKASETSFLGWTLQEYVDGAYYPVSDGSTAVTPSSSTGYNIASQGTFTFRNDAFKLVKFVLMELNVGSFDNFPYASLNANLQSLVDSLSGQAVDDIGRWWEGRDGRRSEKSFHLLTTTLNRKLRRARGLVG